MQSSRMRTDRSLTVCRSLLPGGGCLLWEGSAPGGVSALGRCLLLGGVCSGGSTPGGVSASRGVSAPRGVCSWGGGVVVSQHALRQTPPPPVNRMTKQVQKYYLGHNFIAAGNKTKTRMHSSRMHTARSFTIQGRVSVQGSLSTV